MVGQVAGRGQPGPGALPPAGQSSASIPPPASVSPGATRALDRAGRTPRALPPAARPGLAPLPTGGLPARPSARARPIPGLSRLCRAALAPLRRGPAGHGLALGCRPPAPGWSARPAWPAPSLRSWRSRPALCRQRPAPQPLPGGGLGRGLGRVTALAVRAWLCRSARKGRAPAGRSYGPCRCRAGQDPCPPGRRFCQVPNHAGQRRPGLPAGLPRTECAVRPSRSGSWAAGRHDARGFAGVAPATRVRQCPESFDKPPIECWH